MRRFAASLAFVLLSAAALAAQTPTPTPKPAEDEDVVKISTTLIQVDVTVTDKNGKPVTDLKPEDFEIYENGKKQEITNFSFIANAATTPPVAAKTKENSSLPPPPSAQLKPEQVRRTIALVVDDLSLSFESTHFVQQALKKFVNEQMQDGDLVAIIRTGAGIGALQQFTSDKRQLLAAIEKIRWNPLGTGGISAFAPIDSSGVSNQSDNSDDENSDDSDTSGGQSDFDNFRESVFSTGTLGAVNYVVRGMRELPGRKSIMLLSDGFQIFSRNPNGREDFSRVLESLRRLTDLANRSSVVIYTMDARGLQTLGLTAADDTGGLSADQVEQKLSDRRNKLFDTQEGLIYLAQATGGVAVRNSNDLSGGIKRMLNDQSYYLVGYQPDTETFDLTKSRFNKLSVKVKRKGVDVRYRSGFFGVTDDKIEKPTLQTPAQQITNALTSPFAVNDISLRLNTIFGNEPKQGAFVTSLLHVNAKDLKFTDEPDGSKKAVFDVLAISFGDNGSVVDQISKSYTMTLKDEAYKKIIDNGFVYHFTFPVKKPGAYQYRVAIRDGATQKLGSANQFIEVPNLKKNRLTLSGLTLENLTTEQWNGNSKNAADSQNKIEPTDPLTDTSLRQFKRGTILRYGYQIYNAKLDAARRPQVITQVRIFHDGKSVFDGKQLPLELYGQTDFSQIKAIGAINLGTDMPAGEYILQIVVTDNLAKEKRRVTAQFVQFEIL